MQFVAPNTADTSTLDRLRDGRFALEHRISLKGDNSAFISQAAIGTFSLGASGAEQLVVLQGDQNTFNGINDKIYYDISWTWEELGVLASSVTNNDLVESDQDDNGTYASICALDCDDDTMRVEYQGCEYGWSEPELYCVLQSPPYWRELLYDSTGSVSFEVTSGTGDGTEMNYNIGGGIYAEGSMLFGAGFLGNDGRLGVTGSIDIVGSKAHSETSMHSEETAWRITVSPGQDHAMVFA